MAHTVCPTSKRSVMKWHYMAHPVCPTTKRSVMRRHYMAHPVCVARCATSGLPLDRSKGKPLTLSRKLAPCAAFSAIVQAAAQL